MERARATWTDERLDDLSARVDRGFTRLDEDLRALRVELANRIDAQGAELSQRIDAQGAELSQRIDAQGAEFSRRIGGLEIEASRGFESVNARFDLVNERFDRLQRTMIQVGGGLAVTMLATLVSVVATRA